VALVLIAYFALCHGYAYGAEVPLSADLADYAIGFVLATGMIHLFGIGIGLGLNKPMHRRLSQARSRHPERQTRGPLRATNGRPLISMVVEIFLDMQEYFDNR
jgi:hypothetical protein